MDDSSVSQINSATVLKQNAYLLFYEKIVDSKPKNQLKKDLVGEKPILPVKKIIEPIRPVETVPVKQVVPPEPLRIVKVTPVLQPDLPIKVNSTMKWSVQSVSPPERVQKEEISSNKPRTPEVGGNRNLPTKKSKSRFTDDHYDSKDEIVIPTELVLAETKSEPSIRNEKPKFEFKSPRKSFNGDFEATKNRCSNIEQPKLNFKDGAAAIANGNAKMIFSDFKPQKSKVQKDNRETLNGLSNSRPKFPAGNSFLDELVANSVQSNSVLPWGHLENSDIISNRKRIEEEMREKTRLKRPTKDDILYDAPKYKKKIKL